MNLSNTTDLFERVSESEFALSEPCLSPKFEQEITLEMELKELVNKRRPFDPLVTDCFGSSRAEMVASALSSFPQADIMTSNTVGDINIKYGYGMPIVVHHPII